MPAPWNEGYATLLEDPYFGPVVERVGPPQLRPPRGSAFASLSAAIVYQQLAGKAALTIHRRFVDALDGRVTPERVLRAEPEALRAAGLSRNKLAAIQDLAVKATDGTVRLRGLPRRSDGEVVERLTRVRGIGRWTAEMFLMFNLHRPDVWPVGDLGVRNGWARIHALAEPLGPAEMETVADHLRPWRSAAAWYCWRAVEVLTPDG